MRYNGLMDIGFEQARLWASLADEAVHSWAALVRDERMLPLLTQLAAYHAMGAGQVKEESFADRPRSYPEWIFTHKALRATVSAGDTPSPNVLSARSGARWVKPQSCFANSLLLANLSPEWLYVEGWASSGIIAVAHAWNVHRETGELLDLTWSREPGDPNYLYAGVAFDGEFAFRLQEKRSGSVVEGDWLRGNELLFRPQRVGQFAEVVGWGKKRRHSE